VQQGLQRLTDEQLDVRFMVVGGLLLQLGKDEQPRLFGTDEWEEIFPQFQKLQVRN
jgi:hypothetical protein